MKFPVPPFEIDNDEHVADAALVRYLQNSRHFPYIRRNTRNLIARLAADDLRKQNPLLINLWPRVLTDSLRMLKRYDPREWDRSNKAVSYGSFFHEGSLGVTALRDVLKSFAEFEGMLYGASPGEYRDHIAHAFRVWIIGHAILKGSKCFKGILFSDELVGVSNDVGEKGDQISGICPVEWECMWAIAALCHDLGYPLSHIAKINTLARETLEQMGLLQSGNLRFAFSQQMLPFHDTVIRLMASRPAEGNKGYHTHIQNKYYMKLLKSFDNLDHGVVSSLLISKALVYFLESDLSHDNFVEHKAEDIRQFLIRREILRAIAAHTCQDMYHLRFDTLSFLLFMVDEIQCWGRPTLEELQHPSSAIPSAKAKVIAFQPKRISIVISTGERDWSEAEFRAAEKQLNKLYCMLRLGVGTAMLSDHYLEFVVRSELGMGTRLLLKNGKLSLSRMLPSKHARSPRRKTRTPARRAIRAT